MTYFRSIFYSLVVLCILCMPLQAIAGETLSVQVKESEIRATPSFLGKIIARIAYGEMVEVVENSGSWKNVSIKDNTAQGWIHESALSTERIILHEGQTDARTGATQDELALAGKGFNKQVEEEFIKQNKDLDYTWINRMEKFEVTPEVMETFLARGEVNVPSEGGAR
jgi:SH3-like domain-containing protein